MAGSAQEAEKKDAESEGVDTEAATPECLDRKIRNYMLGTMGVSLIPAPALDMAAITALQVKMVADLADAYDVPFKESLGRSLIMSLVGTLGAGHLALGSFGSLMKLVPGFGNLLAVLTLPVMVGGATYALGKVFKLHFATGGTLLDFDIDEMREHFRAEFQDGVDEAKKSKPKAKA